MDTALARRFYYDFSGLQDGLLRSPETKKKIDMKKGDRSLPFHD
tara:strand:+ start:450 stop:581 length:132 start_codon:yes stop_codon:yes gene_type:complete